MRLKDIKSNNRAELLNFAERLEVESAAALKRHD
jgi:hypothetical protein